MTLRIVLVDDDHDSRVELADQLSKLGRGTVDVSDIPPPEHLDLTGVLAEDCDLYLVDYELDSIQPDGSHASYRGMTLASRLREVKPAYPIALLTRSDIQAWSQAQRTTRAGRVFDDVLYKEENLRDRPESTYLRLLSLARGYRSLRRSKSRSVDNLLELLQTDRAGHEYATEALPPADGWQEVEAAQWIRGVLLRYPGVVYTDAHAATAVGLSLDCFRRPSVLELLEPAKYKGPFSEDTERWWAHSLLDIVNRLCASRQEGVGLRKAFRQTMSNHVGRQLTPARDIETGRAPADTVCHILNVPVRIETSLPYQPDSRPPIMDEARVSFTAIRESNDVKRRYIDPSSRERLDKLQMAVS